MKALSAVPPPCFVYQVENAHGAKEVARRNGLPEDNLKRFLPSGTTTWHGQSPKRSTEMAGLVRR